MLLLYHTASQTATPGSSPDLHYTHAYTATGVYTVSLTASGPSGSDTLTRTNYITVSPAVDITYVYDPLYRLVTATYSTGEFYQYAYDAVGNRLSLTTTVGVW